MYFKLLTRNSSGETNGNQEIIPETRPRIERGYLAKRKFQFQPTYCLIYVSLFVLRSFLFVCKEGKAVPLQAWSGPEGYRKLRFPNYMTTAQDGGKVVSLMHRQPLLPRISPGTHFC
jgi:hypothetical protein